MCYQKFNPPAVPFPRIKIPFLSLSICADELLPTSKNLKIHNLTVT